MSSENLKLTQEEALKNEEHKKWLEEHPFTKKWEETCPYFSYDKNPLYEKPKPAKIINRVEKTDMTKEIKIENQCDPRDIYIAENNRNPQREAVEERLKMQEERLKAKCALKEYTEDKKCDEDRMNLEAGWYCKHETKEDPEFAREREENARELRKHVLTPNDELKLKSIWDKHKEKLELEKHLNEVRQELEDEEIEKENNNPIKKYEEEVIRENVRKSLQKGMLSDKEEEEIKEKFENPEFRSVYDILAGMLSFLFPYKPGENIDKSRKISESDMIDVAANLIPRMREAKKNMFYDKHKLPKNKAEDVEKLAKDLSGYNNVVKKEYVVPKCELVENTPSIRGDFDGICQEMMELHRRKNNDYGNAAQRSFEKFGIISYVMRLGDKMNRLETLTNPDVEQKVKGEKIEDTLMDLAAYAIMAIESLRNP